MSGKVYVVRLVHAETRIYVTKAKHARKSLDHVRVRRGQWAAYEGRSAFAKEFGSLKDAKRVLKAKAIKKAIESGYWRAEIMLDVSPARRPLLAGRKMQEVWPRPNAIELLAKLAG